MSRPRSRKTIKAKMDERLIEKMSEAADDDDPPPTSKMTDEKAPVPWNGPRWEYWVEYPIGSFGGVGLIDVLNARLDELGAEGWELVATTRCPDGGEKCHFKRQLGSS